MLYSLDCDRPVLRGSFVSAQTPVHVFGCREGCRGSLTKQALYQYALLIVLKKKLHLVTDRSNISIQALTQSYATKELWMWNKLKLCFLECSAVAWLLKRSIHNLKFLPTLSRYAMSFVEFSLHTKLPQVQCGWWCQLFCLEE